MDRGHELIAAAAAKLAGELPLDTAHFVAGLIESSPHLAAAAERLADLPHPYYRKHATSFVGECSLAAPLLPPQSVALALLAAARCEAANRHEQAVELVWTGPDASAIPIRRTESLRVRTVPPTFAEIVPLSSVVTGFVLMENVIVVAPSGTVTLAGVVAETSVSLIETTRPPAGAGFASCSLPMTERHPGTIDLLRLNVGAEGSLS